jgi:hypothetical protein
LGEIAYAVFDVASGAERQVRMIEEACTAGPRPRPPSAARRRSATCPGEAIGLHEPVRETSGWPYDGQPRRSWQHLRYRAQDRESSQSARGAGRPKPLLA